MKNLLEFIKILGGLAGFAALIWRFVDEFGTYLRISVEVSDSENGLISVLTTVDNKGNRRKNIAYTFLLVGPENESPVDTATALLKELGLSIRILYTNDIGKLWAEQPIYVGQRALLPLPFFYTENIAIADETLTYRTFIDGKKLAPESTYSVRLFVFVTGRLHRSTQDAFYNKQTLETDSKAQDDTSAN